MSEPLTPPAAQGGHPGLGEPMTAPPITPSHVNERPVWTSAAVLPQVEPAVNAATPRNRRSAGPGFTVAAVFAAAILASGGTYVAVTAADGGRSAGTPTAVTTPVIANGTQTPTAIGPAAGQANVVDIVKSVSPAVVTIVADGVTETDPTTGQSGTGTAIGSGVIFDANGLILTNHHVVAGDPSKLTVNLNDGRSFDATVYGIDTLTDLAIVKVAATGLPTAPIGDSSTIQVGQQAIAIGSPLGTFTDSVTSGIVSAIGRSIPVESGQLSNLIQTDTAINPGNSGGPLLDPSGQVIGINTAVASSSQGIGFAIPIDIARPLLAQASAGKPLARPWLGVVFQTIDPTVKDANGLSVDNGAWIPTDSASAGAASGDQGATGVTPTDPNAPGTAGPAQESIVAGGPAAQAGLQAGDIITAVDGTALDATHPLDLVMSQHAPGDKVSLTVLRNGQTTTVTVTLGTRPTTT
jgi:S1-C subfamily serine protease